VTKLASDTLGYSANEWYISSGYKGYSYDFSKYFDWMESISFRYIISFIFAGFSSIFVFSYIGLWIIDYYGWMVNPVDDTIITLS
jgi:hypothetical protein